MHCNPVRPCVACSMSSVHVCSIAWYPAHRMWTLQTNTTYPAIYLSPLWDKILLHSLHSLPPSTLFHTLILCNVFNYVGESEGLPGNRPRPPSDPHGVHCRHHRCESPDTPWMHMHVHMISPHTLIQTHKSVWLCSMLDIFPDLSVYSLSFSPSISLYNCRR